jgi:hypothetical protein
VTYVIAESVSISNHIDETAHRLQNVHSAADLETAMPTHLEAQIRRAAHPWPLLLQEPVLTGVAGKLGAGTGQPESCCPQSIDQVPGGSFR